MMLKSFGYFILSIIINPAIHVLASPGNDWLEKEKRKSEEEINDYDMEIDFDNSDENETNILIGTIAIIVIVLLVVLCCCCCCFFCCCGRLSKKKQGKVKYKYSQRFQMLERAEAIPNGYRLASIHDVLQHEEEAHSAIYLEWGICTLADGRISGSGYQFKIEQGSFFDLGHKLIANISYDIPKANHGMTPTSSNFRQPYNPISTSMPSQPFSSAKYPSQTDHVASSQIEYDTPSYLNATSQSQYPNPSTQFTYQPQNQLESNTENALPPSDVECEVYSTPQVPYNPNFTTDYSPNYDDPPPAYSGDISNTPVIQ